MRVGLVLGIGSVLTALVIGVMHEAFTGDASIVRTTLRGIIYASVLALMFGLRTGSIMRLRMRLAGRGRA